MSSEIQNIRERIPATSWLKRLKKAIARRLYDRRIVYRNREGLKEYDFELRPGRKPAGTSVMLRAKNEEDMIEMSMRSIYDVFDEIVFIDNGSEDATVSVVERLKAEIDERDSIRILSYPFPVARCGAEHAAMPDDSVHSLVYYYNWCLSRLTRNYAVKWDADMYLKPAAKPVFKAYLAAIQSHELRFEVPIQTVYLDAAGNAYEAADEVNIDNQIFPNRTYVHYVKGEHWESLRSELYIPQLFYPDADIYEVKDTRNDEFSHWTDTAFTTPRKRREWENYTKVKAGDLGEGFRAIDSAPFSRVRR